MANRRCAYPDSAYRVCAWLADNPVIALRKYWVEATACIEAFSRMMPLGRAVVA